MYNHPVLYFTHLVETKFIMNSSLSGRKKLLLQVLVMKLVSVVTTILFTREGAIMVVARWAQDNYSREDTTLAMKL